MPFDGSGNYSPPGAPTFPAVTGTTITAAYYNSVINDITTALSNCITRDGQGKPSANINWNSKNLTGIAQLTSTTLTTSGVCNFGGDCNVTGNVNVSGALNVTAGATVLHSLALGSALGTSYGGTGTDASAAANGALLIGNGAGFSLATLGAGAGISITNSVGGITIAATGAGGTVTTSFPVTFNNGGAGAASGTTFDGSAAKTISWNSIGARPYNPQLQSVGTSATVTPTFSNDLVRCVGQDRNVTFANPTGTAIEGFGIVIRIKDNGTARTISWGTQYRGIGVTLPTTTVVSKMLYIGMIYNSTDTKWDVISTAQEA
jgi:hypothetical protein